MPIIEMKKAFLLGHREEREKVFNLLHEMGNVHLLDIKEGDAWNDIQSLLEPEQAAESIAQVDATLTKVRYCLDFFQRYFPVRKNIVQQFTGVRVELTGQDYDAFINRLDQVSSLYDTCRKAEDKLARIRNEETQSNNLIEELKPWQEFTVPLELIKDGSFTRITLCTVSVDHVLSLRSELAEKLYAYYLEEIFSDNEIAYLCFAGLAEEKQLIQDIFKEQMVYEIYFPGLTGTISQNINLQQEKLEQIAKERVAELREVEALLELRPMLMACHDHTANELDKYEAVSNLAGTENSFMLEGWIPAPLTGELDKIISEKTDTAILAVRNPEPGEDVPVLLHNNGPIENFEVVTNLYSTPKKKDLDPTPFLSPFFFIFFGICLGDVGYGLILTLLTVYISRNIRLEGKGKQLVNLLKMGGISAIFFGILSGSYFGDLIKLPALWFNPLDDPMRMLFFSFGLGLIHVYLGMALQAYRNIKAGQPLSALYDQGFWFIFLNGLILYMFGFSVPGQGMAVLGAIGLILTQGRAQRNIVLKFFSGVLSLYYITQYLSDILSYSRLFALGLASVVIGMVVNSMGELVSGNVIGLAIMVVILIGGHIFNTLISTLSAYVHTSRLQYLEFFSKFFEGGGKSFQPFKIKNSYIDIVETEKG